MSISCRSTCMEGHDREVLAGLDTEAVQIDVLVVEMNDNKRLWEVLWGRGYSCVTCVYDCVFVHGASKHAERLDELRRPGDKRPDQRSYRPSPRSVRAECLDGNKYNTPPPPRGRSA